MAALPATAKRLAAAALYLPDAEISEGLRIRLMLTRFVAAGFVVYFLVCLPEIATSSVLVAAWWTPVGVLLAFAPGWLLLAATFSRAWQRRSNVLVIACAVGYLAAVATWYLAWTGEAATGEHLVADNGLVGLRPGVQQCLARLVPGSNHARCAKFQGQAGAIARLDLGHEFSLVPGGAQ